MHLMHLTNRCTDLASCSLMIEAMNRCRQLTSACKYSSSRDLQNAGPYPLTFCTVAIRQCLRSAGHASTIKCPASHLVRQDATLGRAMNSSPSVQAFRCTVCVLSKGQHAPACARRQQGGALHQWRQGGPPAPATAWPRCGGLATCQPCLLSQSIQSAHTTGRIKYRNKVGLRTQRVPCQRSRKRMARARCIGQCVQYCPDLWQVTLGLQDFMHAGSLQDLVVAVGGGRGCITILFSYTLWLWQGVKRRIAYTPCYFAFSPCRITMR